MRTVNQKIAVIVFCLIMAFLSAIACSNEKEKAELQANLIRAAAGRKYRTDNRELVMLDGIKHPQTGIGAVA